jgi:hypothetical protein
MREDWNTESDLRQKLIRNQDERGRTDTYRGDRTERDWITKGKGVWLTLSFNVSIATSLATIRRTARTHCIVTVVGEMATKVLCLENKGLRVCGFGLPGQGFYNIRVPIKKGGKKEARGVMTILQGAATVEMIRTELRALFRENVDWEITKLSIEKEFMIVFPNDDKRHQLARIKNFEFETANIKAHVRPTELNPGANGYLEVVWVWAYNFPDYALSPEVVMEVAHLVGDPEEVDLASLKWQGPVRVKLGCRDSREVKGETHVFFNGDSHRIKWVVESSKDQFDKETNTSKFDRHIDKADEEEEEEGDTKDKNRPKQQQNKKNMEMTSDA